MSPSGALAEQLDLGTGWNFRRHGHDPLLQHLMDGAKVAQTHSSRPGIGNSRSPTTEAVEDLGYIGRHGIGLSGSYQQGYSTAYNAQSHIKVVCNGYILAHISNCNPWSHLQTLPSTGRSPPCMTRGQRPICVLVTHARVNIAAFWHGF